MSEQLNFGWTQDLTPRDRRILATWGGEALPESHLVHFLRNLWAAAKDLYREDRGVYPEPSCIWVAPTLYRRLANEGYVEWEDEWASAGRRSLITLFRTVNDWQWWEETHDENAPTIHALRTPSFEGDEVEVETEDWQRARAFLPPAHFTEAQAEIYQRLRKDGTDRARALELTALLQPAVAA